jgi:myosin protein heavy chain
MREEINQVFRRPKIALSSRLLHSESEKEALQEKVAELMTQIAQERDAAERDAREKKTKVLSLTRELGESYVTIEEIKRKPLQTKLDELTNTQVRITRQPCTIQWF